MSTEAMREAFQKHFHMVEFYQEQDAWGRWKYKHPHVQSLWDGWQAATANQEALIKAALDAAAEKCEETFLRDEDLGILMPAFNDDCAEAIRQITPQQVMERMK